MPPTPARSRCSCPIAVCPERSSSTGARRRSSGCRWSTATSPCRRRTKPPTTPDSRCAAGGRRPAQSGGTMTIRTPGTETDRPSVTQDDTAVVPEMRTDADAPAQMTEEDLLSLGGLERPLPFPILKRRSGVYTRRLRIPILEKFPFSPIAVGMDADAMEGEALGDLTPTPDGPLPIPNLPIPRPQIPTLPPIPFPQRYRYGTEELRVDVDGRAPTMTVSGIVPGGLFVKRLTW